MKISIITINYNNKDGLQKTIESVVTQTSKEFEFIIIDGNSTDGSKDIIAQYQSNFTHAISEPDTGIYNAMNKGIAKSNGEYLLFLNSGDWLNNNQVIASIKDHLCDADVISGDMNVFQDSNWNLHRSQDTITVDYFLRISLYHQATFIKKELFTKCGLYDESFKLGGDYEFFIRTLLKQEASYKRIPFLISNFLTDGISNNKDFLELNYKERELAWKKHFSKVVYTYFEKSNQMSNSKELKWGNRFFKFFPFANLLDKIFN